MNNIRRVAMIGAFDPEYTRHAVIIEGLKQVGVEVRLMNQPKNVRTPGRLLHILRASSQLRDVDAVIIPAFNQLSVPFVWLMSHFFRRPVLVDYMVGLTDALEDRGTVPNWKYQVFRRVDRFNASRLSSITDTGAHIEYYRDLLGESLERMRVVPVGARQVLADTVLPSPSSKAFVVQYPGSYIPFHSVETILRAAALLKDHPCIQFELIGRGQTYESAFRLKQSLELDNVKMIPHFYHPPELFEILAHGSIYLGVFGDANKTRYVVPTKVYEMMVLGRPVVTAESPALREFFVPGEHLLTVPPEDPPALADAICRLANLREFYDQVAAAGAKRMREAYLPRHIGEKLKIILEQI